MAVQGCGATIEAAWKRDVEVMACNKVLKKIQNCGEALMKWSKTSFGSVRHELKEKRKLLAKAETTASRGGDVTRVRRLEQEINLLMDREAQMWSQRSKIQWFRDGDRNTRFFHSKASERRRHNYIKGLYDREGRWCRIREAWWKRWWIFIKSYLLPPIRTVLMKFWSKSHR